MEQFDPNDLLIFARVAERGSFSRAAEGIDLPKSTLSRRIALLEERLGERLMVRTTRRLALTELGEQVLEHARQLADEVDAVRALVEHRRAVPSGRLRVSLPSDLTNLLLGEMLARFIADFPEVRLELDLSPRRVDLPAEGFDLAVRTGPLPDDALLAARPLAVFPFGLYASPGYLARQGAPSTPDDLERHALLGLGGRDREPTPWVLISDQARRDAPTAHRALANSPEVLIRLAIAGVGIAAVPNCFVAAAVARGRLHRVLPDWSLPAHRVWAVFPGRRLMPAKVRHFIDRLERTLAEATGTPAAP